jgi:hypothetical protein
VLDRSKRYDLKDYPGDRWNSPETRTPHLKWKVQTFNWSTANVSPLLKSRKQPGLVQHLCNEIFLQQPFKIDPPAYFPYKPIQ